MFIEQQNKKNAQNVWSKKRLQKNLSIIEITKTYKMFVIQKYWLLYVGFLVGML